LNPNNAADASLYRKDGYTNIEYYLSSLVSLATVVPSPGTAR
jgi:hypothetical protein